METIREFFNFCGLVILVIFKLPFIGLAKLWKHDFVKMVTILLCLYIASIHFICLDLHNILEWQIYSRGAFTVGILFIIGLSYLIQVVEKKD